MNELLATGWLLQGIALIVMPVSANTLILSVPSR